MTLPTLYTTADLAAALKCSEDKVRDFVAQGKVTPYRLDDSPRAPMRFSEEHYRELLTAMQQPGQPAAASQTTTTTRRRRRRAA